MALPQSTSVPPVVALVVRVLTLVALLTALIVLVTNTITITDDYEKDKIKFSDLYAYRYLLATAVIGMAYTLLQTVFAVYFVSTGKRLGGNGLIFFDFYGDKVLSYILATGAAAGFGVTLDMKHLADVLSMLGFASSFESFLNKGNAAAGVVLAGFVFSAISSVFSSFCLPKTSS